MKNYLLSLFLLVIVGKTISQNKVSLQFLGSSINYWTLNYERVLLKPNNSEFILGTGLSFRKSFSNSFMYFTHEEKASPLFFNNSLYLKYVISDKNILKPHVSIGYIYSMLINKNNVGDSWKGISRLKEYKPVEPSLFLNLGTSFYFKERLGVNLDVYLYKQIDDLERFPGYPFFFLGVGFVYDF